MAAGPSFPKPDRLSDDVVYHGLVMRRAPMETDAAVSAWAVLTPATLIFYPAAERLKETTQLEALDLYPSFSVVSATPTAGDFRFTVRTRRSVAHMGCATKEDRTTWMAMLCAHPCYGTLSQPKMNLTVDTSARAANGGGSTPRSITPVINTPGAGGESPTAAAQPPPKRSIMDKIRGRGTPERSKSSETLAPPTPRAATPRVQELKRPDSVGSNGTTASTASSNGHSGGSGSPSSGNLDDEASETPTLNENGDMSDPEDGEFVFGGHDKEDDAGDDAESMEKRRKKSRDPKLVGACISRGIGEAVRGTPDPAVDSQPEDTDFRRHGWRNPTMPITTAAGTEEIKFDFQDFAPLVFARLRRRFAIPTEEYLTSVANTPLTGGSVGDGKSGSLFYCSADKYYIVKTLTETELKFLLTSLPDYYQHMMAKSETLLPRFLGVYRLKFAGRVVRIMIMNNVFLTNLKINEKYDLKGSTYGREVQETGTDDRPVVLKDLNFKSKLYMGPKKQAFIDQLKDDVAFLDSHGMMDYSLLLGIHRAPFETVNSLFALCHDAEEPEDIRLPSRHLSSWQLFEGGYKGTQPDGGTRVYFIGIIDILQEYNIKKKGEHAFKSILVKDSNSISAIEASAYGRRFLDYVESIVE